MKRNRLLFTSLALASLCIPWTPSAKADTVLDTIGLPVAGPAGLNPDNTFGFTFIVGPEDSVLNHISATLASIGMTDYDLQGVLYEASVAVGPGYGLPVGPELGVFTYDILSPTYDTTTFTPTTGITLEANKAYTFAIRVIPIVPDPSGPSFSTWALVDSSDGYGPTGTDWGFLPLMIHSADNVTWARYVESTDYRFSARVDAEAIPEPSSLLLLAGSSAATWGFWFRRRKALV